MPKLNGSQTAMMNAFTFLSGGRTNQLGFGVSRPNPIAIGEMVHYWQVFSPPYPLSTFVSAIRQFDAKYIKEEIDRITAEAKRKKPPGRR